MKTIHVKALCYLLLLTMLFYSCTEEHIIENVDENSSIDKHAATVTHLLS
jgi:hypothetical protein